VFSAVGCRLLGVGFDCQVKCRWQLFVTGLAGVGCLMVSVDCRLLVVVVGFLSSGCPVVGLSGCRVLFVDCWCNCRSLFSIFGAQLSLWVDCSQCDLLTVPFWYDVHNMTDST
jgi:hypothetical protein